MIRPQSEPSGQAWERDQWSDLGTRLVVGPGNETGGQTWERDWWSGLGTRPVVGPGNETGGRAWERDRLSGLGTRPVVGPGNETGCRAWERDQWSGLGTRPVVRPGRQRQQNYPCVSDRSRHLGPITIATLCLTLADSIGVMGDHMHQVGREVICTLWLIYSCLEIQHAS